MKKSKDKVLGALLGVAIGDALGAPLEFMSVEEIHAKHGGCVREMIGGGWLNVAPGEITDDTQMTLAVAEGITENPCDPIPTIGRRFIEWYDSRPKDIGNCCRAAISYAKEFGAVDFHGWFKAAQRVHEESGGQTAGNGALMRTIYPALWYGSGGSSIIKAELIIRIARMTHIHNHSCIAVMAYTWAVIDLITEYEDLTSGLQWKKERIEYHMKKVRELTGEKPEPTGYAPDSLVCAINAIRDTGSFEDALTQAVNLGGDADTIGAITGGLAGALYGAEAIPQRWTDALSGDVMSRLSRLASQAYSATI